MRRLFWRVYYRLFPPRPPAGKGTRENPLEMADLEPLMRCLDRVALKRRES